MLRPKLRLRPKLKNATSVDLCPIVYYAIYTVYIFGAGKFDFDVRFELRLVSKYSDPTMMYSNTMGIRVIMVDNMSSDPNPMVDTMTKSEYLVSKYSDPTMVYSNTMGIRVIMVDNMSLGPNPMADTMTKSEYLVTKYSDPTMVYSNSMGIRVIIVDNMSSDPNPIVLTSFDLAHRGI